MEHWRPHKLPSRHRHFLIPEHLPGKTVGQLPAAARGTTPAGSSLPPHPRKNGLRTHPRTLLPQTPPQLPTIHPHKILRPADWPLGPGVAASNLDPNHPLREPEVASTLLTHLNGPNRHNRHPNLSGVVQRSDPLAVEPQRY